MIKLKLTRISPNNPDEPGRNNPAASSWKTRRKAWFRVSAWRFAFERIAKCAKRSIIQGFIGANSGNLVVKSRRIRIRTLTEEFAFSSNHRMWRIADKLLTRLFCNSGLSTFLMFCGTVAMSKQMRACQLKMSNPFSVSCMLIISAFEITSVFMLSLRFSSTFLLSASMDSFVGIDLKMTTKSAMFLPVRIVPFLKDPTCRTSSSWHLSKSPGATTKLSRTDETLVTRLLSACCSLSVGVNSWLRFVKACNKFESSGTGLVVTRGK